MSLPVRITDNDVCSDENIDPDGGNGEHDFDEEGQGTHRYCGTLENIGTPESPGSNPLCAYTIEKTNPNGEIHHVCVTADGRLLDGNTGASRANIFLQPYKKTDGTKSAWAIIGYEESKGVGTPPDGDHDGRRLRRGRRNGDHHPLRGARGRGRATSPTSARTSSTTASTLPTRSRVAGAAAASSTCRRPTSSATRSTW